VNTPGVYANVPWYKAWIQKLTGIDDKEVSVASDSTTEEHPVTTLNSGAFDTSTTGGTDKIKTLSFANQIAVMSAVIIFAYLFK
jgi:hypothetical protein